MPGFRLVPGSRYFDIGLTPTDYTPVDPYAPWPVYDVVPWVGHHGLVNRIAYVHPEPSVWPDRAPQLSPTAARKLARAKTIEEARAALSERFRKAARRHFGYYY